MHKKLLVAALSLLALVAGNALSTHAQACPNHATFGVRAPLNVDKNLQSQLEVVYFTTDDPNAFISEKAGLNRSASSINLNANQFAAKLKQLAADGVASIKKQQSATLYLGELAELNLERDAVNAARTINASLTAPDPRTISGLDRETELSVYQLNPTDDYYHLSLLSWFVNVTPTGVRKTVDHDADIFVRPGQTVVIKLLSDMEVKRSGAVRSHMAVTMRAVNKESLTTLGGR
jgi:hypothetical protein